MKTVIMAGGKGTRISELFPNTPKPLIPINNMPVLEWEICLLRDQGIKEIIITVSYMADKIMSYFGNGSKWGVNIEYYKEKTPLGSAGALFKLQDRLIEDFLLLNADIVFDVNFSRMIDFHRRKNALVTLFTHPNSHPFDSGLIITDNNGGVIKWMTREETRPTYYKNRVNAGLHIINPKVLDIICEDSNLLIDTGLCNTIENVDLDRQILKPMCKTGGVFAYDSPEYVKDMGTPERYESVCNDIKKGVVSAKNLSKRQKAIFLDRDGTINKLVGFLRKTDEFELLDGVSEAIKMINQSEYLTIIITNQPVIARGEVTVGELQEIHYKMETLLGEEGAYIDGLYYCPHHPQKGFNGEISELKIECECRKPKPGLIYKAAEEFNIDTEKSWFIGDGETDIIAGRSAGCKTVLIGNKNYRQDIMADSLLDAIKKILKE